MTNIKNSVITFSNGVSVINTTPHPITFLDGETVIQVPVSGILINSKVIEEVVKEGVPTLVRSTFVSSPESEKLLSKIEQEVPGVLVVGSIVAAQGFPGRVVGMTPSPGFERVPPQEKRMSISKFTTFA